MPQRVSRGRWLATLSILIGIALPVPLILLLGIPKQEELRDRLPGGAQVSPMLSYEEQLKLATFLRDCTKSEECDPPLACLQASRLFRQVCIDSECVTDLQCPAGESCQVIPSISNGPRLRMCIRQGERREGEQCDLYPIHAKDACMAGLFCREGWCGRACQREVPASCPEGFFCSNSAEGPVCLPTCEERGCPEGQQCVRFNKASSDRVSACVKVRGENCQQTSCAQDQKCMVLRVPERPGEVEMSCATLCDRGRPPCPEGLICHRLFCRRPCDPKRTAACGPDRECQQIDGDGPWVCPLE